MRILPEFLTVFQFCCCVGWLLEVLYRSTVEKHFVNPGFLFGPWLPIYGFGGLFVYLLCKTDIADFSSPGDIILFFVLSCIVMTVLEAAAGLILLYKFKTRLWNYSNLFGNFKGVVCPLFSVIWGIVCVLFRFLIYPKLSRLAASAEFVTSIAFLSGAWTGIFVIDLWSSLNLAEKLRQYAQSQKTVVHIEKLKRDIYNRAKHLRELPRFHVFKGRSMLRKHIEKILSEINDKKS